MRYRKIRIALLLLVAAEVVSGLGAQGLKRIFGRARPDQGGDPNSWFRGSCCQSFPSGEVALQASFVTPVVVDYAREHPMGLGTGGVAAL